MRPSGRLAATVVVATLLGSGACRGSSDRREGSPATTTSTTSQQSQSTPRMIISRVDPLTGALVAGAKLRVTCAIAERSFWTEIEMTSGSYEFEAGPGERICRIEELEPPPGYESSGRTDVKLPDGETVLVTLGGRQTRDLVSDDRMGFPDNSGRTLSSEGLASSFS